MYYTTHARQLAKKIGWTENSTLARVLFLPLRWKSEKFRCVELVNLCGMLSQ
jgi:hypothetical protein